MSHRLTCLITAEREGWILRRIAKEVLNRATLLDATLQPARDPIQSRPDCIFYSDWNHYWRQPDNIRRIPGIALVTHLDRFAFRLAAMARQPGMRIACMSKRYLRMLRWYGIPSRKLLLTPMGIDLDRFQPKPSQEIGTRIRIGILGRLYPDGRKGEVLLKEIAKKLDPAQHELHIIGDRWEEWLARLRTTGLTVHYHQQVADADLPDRIARLDALLITSRREGGPIPALEALACGVPLISRPVGYVPDLLAAIPSAGSLFRNPARAAALLRNARELKAGLACNRTSCQNALEAYTWTTFAASIEKALLQVANRDSQQNASALAPGLGAP